MASSGSAARGQVFPDLTPRLFLTCAPPDHALPIEAPPAAAPPAPPVPRLSICRTSALLAIVPVASFALACAEPTASPRAVSQVNVFPSPLSLATGATQQLTAIVLAAPADTLTDRAVTWESNATAVATVSGPGLVTAVAVGSAVISATAGGVSGNTTVTVSHPVVSISIAPAAAVFTVRASSTLTAAALDAGGDTLLGVVLVWSSSRPEVASVTSAGLVFGHRADTVTIRATYGAVTAGAAITVQPRALIVKGLYVQFERRGWASGYWPGDALVMWDSTDAVVGSTVGAEVGAQLAAMAAMGVNTIAYELRSADATFDPAGSVYPTCNVPPVLGARWPQPLPVEMGGLVKLFDAAHARGISVLLRLTNNHMEEEPRTNAETWLGAIFDAVGTHPALALVLFEGTPKTVDSDGNGSNDACGVTAEPPLWLGPQATPARYVRAAITFARGRGIPATKLSAQAIVGNHQLLSEPPAGPSATDGHLWDPVRVLKTIFDDLAVADSERTYAISFYEHARCSVTGGVPCTDVPPDAWADSTLRRLFTVIGPTSRSRVIAVEMGNLNPVSPGWTTEQALQSLVTRMRARGVEGGALWRWTLYENGESSDPTLSTPVKNRGPGFSFTGVKTLLEALYLAP